MRNLGFHRNWVRQREVEREATLLGWVARMRRSRRCSGQTQGARPLGNWVARRAVSPWINDNYDNHFMCRVWNTYVVITDTLLSLRYPGSYPLQ